MAKGTDAIRLRGIDHLVLRTANVAAMIAFYRDVLGCAVEREVPELGLVQMRAGAALIDLVAVDGALGRRGGAAPGDQGRNLEHFCLTLEDFDDAAVRTELAGQGIAVSETAERYGAGGFGPSLYIRDPDGNGIELKAP